MNNMRNKILSLLVLLLTAATGAQAGIKVGDVFMNRSYVDFGSSGVWLKQYISDKGQLVTVSFSGKLPMTYATYDEGNKVHVFWFQNSNEFTAIYIESDNPAKPLGIKVSGGTGTDTDPFTFTTVYDWPDGHTADIIIDYDGTSSFAMPPCDATATYELVRDMTYEVSATLSSSRIRITNNGNTFEPVNASDLTPVVKDIIAGEDQAVTMTAYDSQTQAGDYTATLQKQGDTENDWSDVTDLSVGKFRYLVTGVNNYDGTTTSATFELFQGYEVTVPKGEYITYYRDDHLRLDDADRSSIELYTISSVSGSTATLSGPFDALPKNTPMLVHNKGTEDKTFFLIPCDEPDLAFSVAPEFKGTLTATTIEASTDNISNYAFNGKQFVIVRSDLDTDANKCWLSVTHETGGTQPGSSSARSIKLVFDNGTTGLKAIDNRQLTMDNWHDLNGRKLSAAPKRKGVYIKNGQKVVVK